MVITGALFGTIILWAIVALLAVVAGRRKEWGFSEKPRWGWNDGIRPMGMRIFAVITTIVVFGGLVFFTPWFVSSWGSPLTRTKVVVSDVVETEPLGLKPDVSYPLVLGARASASETQASTWRGLFGGYAQVRTVSGSAATISFTHDDTTSMLEIPVSHIKFMQSESETPSVTFTFNMALQDEYGWSRGDDERVKYLTSTTTKQFAPCTPQFVDLVLYCVGDTELSSETVISELDPEIARHGLPPLVNANVDVVTVVLTPEMYGQLTGQIN